MISANSHAVASAPAPPGSFSPRTQQIALLAGPLLALLLYLALPDRFVDTTGREAAFTSAGRATLAVALWMAIWWMTEATHIAVTALLPIAVFPLFGIATLGKATAPYASDVIYLFLGGFVLAGAIQRWGLERRIAFHTLRLVGTRADRVIGGFMIATAFISMWVSNTATAAMMVPIALAVIDLVVRQRTGRPLAQGGIPPDDASLRRFAVALLLGIAYSASIGGIGTLIGSPPNGIFARFVEQTYGREVGFTEWMLVGLPTVLVFLPVAWLLLTRVLLPSTLGEIEGGSQWVRRELAALGPLSAGERVTLAVFSVTVVLWLTRPLLAALEFGGARPLAGLEDSGIAVLAAVALFLLPVNGKTRTTAMDWAHAKELPWDLLILFGGGLSLAAAIQANGAGNLIAGLASHFATWPTVAVIGAVAALSVFLSEFTSNTAQVATMLPLLAGMAAGASLSPEPLLLASTLGASAAFMMPVGTPPNAIVFGTGLLSIPQMMRVGFWLNLCSIAIVTAVAMLLA